MYDIKGTTIHLTRGNSFFTQIELKQNKEVYTPQEGDKIMFGLKHPDIMPDKSGYKNKSPLVEKEIPINTMQLALSPNDTIKLPYGKYVYDIKLTFANGDVDTVINNATFVIEPEVI